MDVYLADLWKLSILFGGNTGQRDSMLVHTRASWFREKVPSVLSQGGRYVLWGAIISNSGSHKGWNSRKGTSRRFGAAPTDFLSFLVMGLTVTCHECNGPNHFARVCVKRRRQLKCIVIDATRPIIWSEIVQERKLRTRCPLSSQRVNSALPIVTVYVDGTPCSAVFESGYSRSILSTKLCQSWSKQDVAVTTLTEARQAGFGSCAVRVCTLAGSTATVNVLVIWGEPLDFNLLLGIDAIKALGGDDITQYGSLEFEETQPVCAVTCISEADFNTTFDERQGVWVPAWKWSASHAPEKLRNSIFEYPVSSELWEENEHELQTWMDSGRFLPYSNEEFGPPKRLILLIAVQQTNKHKVCPVVDYCDTFTSLATVCSEKQREWIQQGVNVCILDLRKAYQQVHIKKSLWIKKIPVVLPDCRVQGEAILSDQSGVLLECGALCNAVCAQGRVSIWWNNR